LSKFTRQEPEKSSMDPSSQQTPTWPISGASHDTTGNDVQTIQWGNLERRKSTSDGGFEDRFRMHGGISSSSPSSP
jgi:hypothetical protein